MTTQNITVLQHRGYIIRMKRHGYILQAEDDPACNHITYHSSMESAIGKLYELRLRDKAHCNDYDASLPALVSLIQSTRNDYLTGMRPRWSFSYQDTDGVSDDELDG